jgi:hypothetical protein
MMHGCFCFVGNGHGSNGHQSVLQLKIVVKREKNKMGKVGDLEPMAPGHLLKK